MAEITTSPTKHSSKHARNEKSTSPYLVGEAHIRVSTI